VEEKPIKRRLGFWEGLGSMADDFNDTPQEVLDSLEANLECASHVERQVAGQSERM
jgi:hypothetical protein